MKGVEDIDTQFDITELYEVIENRLGISKDQILGKSRYRPIVDARMVLVYILRTYNKETLQSIGKIIDRDHSAVINLIKRFDDYTTTDKRFKKIYENILWALVNQQNEQ
jgi:chromosomal replication initiation ATPase DnaA